MRSFFVLCNEIVTEKAFFNTITDKKLPHRNTQEWWAGEKQLIKLVKDDPDYFSRLLHNLNEIIVGRKFGVLGDEILAFGQKKRASKDALNFGF